MGDKGNRSRRRIVESARALFHTKGYTSTSMDDIVRESGLTKGSLYHYFTGKEALGTAVVEHMIAEQFAAPQGAGPRDPIRGVVAMFRRAERGLADRRCKGGCLFGNLALEVSDLHDGLRRTVEEAFAGWERQIAHVLESGKRDGYFTPSFQSKAMAHCIVALLEGGILLSKVQRNTRPLKSCTGMVKRLLEGFRTRKSPRPTVVTGG
jgi:TetR/AcrR family transcriptional repressor of nem operon